jgi:D-glycero-D-manno-heptose 1,7-bisphosphate phosphatase
MTNLACKVAFLDRDGTINIDSGYLYREEEWELTPHAAEALCLLRDAGFRIAVETNQSGIAAGTYVESDVHILHAHMRRELAIAGAHVDAIAFCPHSREGDCSCRKPRIGMADHVAVQLNQPIDFEQSWTIGDKLSDVGFGWALGTKTAIIRSRYWHNADLDVKPTLIVASLFEAARKIVALEEQNR